MKEKKNHYKNRTDRAPCKTSLRSPQSITKDPWPDATLRCWPDCSALERRRTWGHQGGIFHISNTLDSQTFANNFFRKTSKKTHNMTFLCLQLYSFVKRKQEVPPQQRLLRAVDLFCIFNFSKACGRLALSDQFPRSVVHRHFLALSSYRLTRKFKKKSSNLLEFTILFWFRLHHTQIGLLTPIEPRWKSKKLPKDIVHVSSHYWLYVK